MSMKKQTISFCRKCKKNTKHKLVEIVDDTTGGERLFLGIVTFGISELTRDPTGIYECEKCGTFKKIFKSWL